MRRAWRAAAIAAAATLALPAAVTPAEASVFPGPQIAGISVGPRYLPKPPFVPMQAHYPDRAYTYVLRFAGTSTADTYQYEERDWSGRHDTWTWSGPTEWSAATSVTRQIEAGTQCFRARARDAYGHVGPWSSSACVSVPRRGDDVYPSGCGTSDVAFRHNRSETCTRATIRTWFRQRAGKVRIGYWSGPTAGSFDVYLGSRKLGHIRATSSHRALHHVTLSAHGRVTGYLKLRGTTGTVQVEDWLVLP
jgi:hypothetical protein